MPSNMIHLLTGLAFVKSSNLVKDKPQFYLGCIAPDAVNVYSFAEKKIRTAAHLRSTDLDQWTQNAIDFYTDNLGKINNDYLLGYVLHAFCDMAWDKKYECLFHTGLEKYNYSKELFIEAKWNEFYYFDKTQLCADWWLNEVNPQLELKIAMDNNEIDKNQINNFKCYIINDYDSTIESIAPKIVTPELVLDFIYYAVATFKNQL